MLVLGIDPGLERMGYGLVRRCGSRLEAVDYGLIQTPRVATGDRLVLLHGRLAELVGRWQPEVAGCERLFFGKNQTTGILVAQALGVAHLACAQAGLACRELTPAQVKQAVVGHGAAEKGQVQFMVQRLLGLASPPKPDDVADALAIAIATALRPPEG